MHVACKVLCNKLHKLVSNEWSKRKSMWDGARRFAIGKQRARSVILRSILLPNALSWATRGLSCMSLAKCCATSCISW